MGISLTGRNIISKALPKLSANMSATAAPRRGRCRVTAPRGSPLLSPLWRKQGAWPRRSGQLLPASTAWHTAARCWLSPVPCPRAAQLRPGSSVQRRGLPRRGRPTAFLLLASILLATSSGSAGSASSPSPAKRAAVLPGSTRDTPVRTRLFTPEEPQTQGKEASPSRHGQPPAQAAAPCACPAGAGWLLCPAAARPPPLRRARAESLCRRRIFRGWGQRQVPGCVDSPEIGGGICW